ncbi:hypothetical protein C2W64_02089 [Brevibacillus laterosporus]|uniref:Uncharacterized protein n=1 Tax=Brevibacillus laterosporus TaxID=1465 RepID=A0A518V4F0_BRELA|nr:hypothetical protein [Brevibacillus laterosporus]QDX91855.1 hypothetical protein EEL30_05435 [Brevibacillus laterosporus]RAP26257.1 hypothetical protein C2W64_02089 [Brevibacillus laterosporus]
MNASKDIQTIDDVVEILEDKIQERKMYLQKIKVDSKYPEHAHVVGQTSGLHLAQTLLLQLQKNQNGKL